jgi:hypothetical protein
MRVILLALVPLLLTSCEILQDIQHPPAFEKPNPQDLAGTYAVTKVSLSADSRDQLRRVSLEIHADGTFQLHNPSPDLTSPLIPGARGTWKLELSSGVDIASGQSWGICFMGIDGTWRTGMCVHSGKAANSPYELVFLDSPGNRVFDDLLVMDRVK